MDYFERREPGVFGKSLSENDDRAYEILEKLVNWFDYQEYDDITNVLFNEHITGDKITTLFDTCCNMSPELFKDALLKMDLKEVAKAITNHRKINYKDLENLEEKNYYNEIEKNR